MTEGNLDGAATALEIARHIREVPEFPKSGISFPAAVDGMARGVGSGTAIAYRACKGLMLARRPKQLPRETISASYDLEYGQNILEVHIDSLAEGTCVLCEDDLLATGGTARAMCHLVENAGGLVAGIAALIKLRFLNGRDRLVPYSVTSLITYDD